MNRKLWCIGLTLIVSTCLHAKSRVWGYCEQGGQVVVTQGQYSSTNVQRSYPKCTVSVFYNGGASGVVQTNGTSVTLLSGNLFGSWNGYSITINAVAYTIASVTSTTSLTLTASAGTQTGSSYAVSSAPVPIYSNSTGSALSNPFTATSTGYWDFYAENGRYDITLSGGGISSSYTWADVSVIDPNSIMTYTNSVIYPSWKCDGVTDITNSYNQTSSFANSINGGTIVLPQGSCVTGGGLKLYSTPLKLIGQGSFYPPGFYTGSQSPTNSGNRGTIIFNTGSGQLFTPVSTSADYFDNTNIEFSNMTFNGGSGVVKFPDVSLNMTFVLRSIGWLKMSGIGFEMGATDGTSTSSGNAYFGGIYDSYCFDAAQCVVNHSNGDFHIQNSYFWDYSVRALDIRGANTNIGPHNTFITKYGNTTAAQDIRLYPTFFFSNGGGAYYITIHDNKFGPEEATSGEARYKISFGDSTQASANPTFPVQAVLIKSNLFYALGGSSSAIGMFSPTNNSVIQNNVCAEVKYCVDDSGMAQTQNAYGNVYRDNILIKGNSVQPMPFKSGGRGFVTISGTGVPQPIDDGLLPPVTSTDQNLIFPSEAVNTYSLSHVTVACSQSDPLGGTGACTLTKTTPGAQYAAYVAAEGTTTVTANQVASMWLKSGSLAEAAIGVQCGSTPLSAIRYFQVTSSWQRYSVRILSVPSSTICTVTLYVGDVLSTTETGTLNVFGWQINSGDIPGGYIKTVGFAATATQDGLSLSSGLLTKAPCVLNYGTNPFAHGGYAGCTVYGDIAVVGNIIPAGSTPTASSCGTAPTVTGSNVNGFVTIGATGTACTITYASPGYEITPKTLLIWDSAVGTLFQPSATSTSAFTFSGTAGHTYNYLIIQ